MNPLRPASLLLLCTLSSACEPESFVCTDDVAPSVRFKVVDGQEVPLKAQVTFTVDGGPERQPDCIGGWTDKGACSLWAAGMEETGRFTVTATVTRTQSRSTQSQQTLVTRDECHVRTRDLTFTLVD